MPIPMDPKPAQRLLLRDVAYERMRDAILDGTLRPGEMLSDEALGRWLQVSRPPLREAITRLAMIELVELLPNRGTRVTPRSADQYRAAERVLNETYELILRRTPQSSGWRDDLEALSADLKQHNFGALAQARRLFAEGAEQSGDRQLAQVETVMRLRALHHQPQVPEGIAWDELLYLLQVRRN
jgi:DNA-binding GntR family transcriptional regulator